MATIFVRTSEDPVFDPDADKQSPTELCVICGRDTGVVKGTPVKDRIYFIQGAGQACTRCGKSNECDPLPGQ